MEQKKSDLSIKKKYSGSIPEEYLDSAHYCVPDTVPTMVLAGFNFEQAHPSFKNDAKI